MQHHAHKRHDLQNRASSTLCAGTVETDNYPSLHRYGKVSLMWETMLHRYGKVSLMWETMLHRYGKVSLMWETMLHRYGKVSLTWETMLHRYGRVSRPQNVYIYPTFF